MLNRKLCRVLSEIQSSCRVIVSSVSLVVNISFESDFFFSFCLLTLHIINQFQLFVTSHIGLNLIFSIQQPKCKQKHGTIPVHKEWKALHLASNLTTGIQILVDHL